MAREREILVAFGKNKQADIETANTAAGMIRMNKLNSSGMEPKLNTENDAEELGKGHPFAENSFNVSWDVQGQMEKYLSAEWAAWVLAYGLGKVVKSGTTPNWIYTINPLDPPADGDELPYFSHVEQMRPGENSIVDRMAVGCAVNGWTLEFGSGPGRANSKLSAEIVGSGRHVEPSLITIPAAVAEKLLPSSSLALTINGVDYVTSKDIVKGTASWKNNLMLDGGFYPGSGFQTAGDATSGAVRGRMEVGDQVCELDFTARLQHDSAEYTKMKAQTEGTAVISFTYNANNSLQLTYQRIRFQLVERGGENGIVVVNVKCLPMWHSTNKLLTVVAKCGLDGITAAEA